jgi:hypothetical protein
MLSLNINFYSLMCSCSLWPTYIGEKGRTLANTYGIKASCYREPLGHTLGTLGTYWELMLSKNSASRLVTLKTEVHNC